MWDLLLSLAKETNGIFATLFVLSVSVNIFQYRLNNSLQEKRLTDWQTALNLANKLAEGNQKIQDSVQIMIQGISTGIQRLLDKEGLK